jgi:phage terminase small subunit
VKSLEGLYLTSFDANRIKINKKVKEYYESLQLYHQSKETNTEIYVPLVIEDATTTTTTTTGSTKNIITKETASELGGSSELKEEIYQDDEDTKKDVKVIKLW